MFAAPRAPSLIMTVAAPPVRRGLRGYRLRLFGVKVYTIQIVGFRVQGYESRATDFGLQVWG